MNYQKLKKRLWIGICVLAVVSVGGVFGADAYFRQAGPAYTNEVNDISWADDEGLIMITDHSGDEKHSDIVLRPSGEVVAEASELTVYYLEDGRYAVAEVGETPATSYILVDGNSVTEQDVPQGKTLDDVLPQTIDPGDVHTVYIYDSREQVVYQSAAYPNDASLQVEYVRPWLGKAQLRWRNTDTGESGEIASWFSLRPWTRVDVSFMADDNTIVTMINNEVGVYRVDSRQFALLRSLTGSIDYEFPTTELQTLW